LEYRCIWIESAASKSSTEVTTACAATCTYLATTPTTLHWPWPDLEPKSSPKSTRKLSIHRIPEPGQTSTARFALRLLSH
jgi:hypothetical protein